MATHRETRTIQINEDLDLDPLELAREFYEANGYAVDLDAITSMELPPERPITSASADAGATEEASGEDAPEEDASTEDASEDAPPEDAPKRARSGNLQMTRGKAGGGWWTSNMTELHVTARLTLRHTALMVTCEVDTTGQHFTEDDVAFWRGELDAAADYVRGEDLMPRDLRDDESMRSSSRSRSSVATGLYGMFIAAFVVVSLFMAWQFYIRMAVAR